MRSDSISEGGSFDEAESMELGAELLAANNEQELDQFLSGLLRRAANRVQKRLDPRTAQQLGGFIKGALRRILPHAGRSTSGWLGLDTSGLGNQLASGAGPLLGLEMEGLSPEDQELAAATQVVKLAGAAAAGAAKSAHAASPEAAAHEALARAAQIHTPGLLKPGTATSKSPRPHGGCGCGGHGTCTCHSHNSGYWVRRGRLIILHEV